MAPKLTAAPPPVAPPAAAPSPPPAPSGEQMLAALNAAADAEIAHHKSSVAQDRARQSELLGGAATLAGPTGPDPVEPETAAPAVAAEAVPAVVEPPKPAPEIDVEKAVSTDPVLKTRMAVLAKTEKRLQEQSAEIKRERGEIETLRASAEKARTTTEEMRRRVQEDPDGFLAEMGITDFLPLAQRAYARVLGDKAPPELRAATAQSDIRQRLARTEAELTSLKTQQVEGNKAAEARQLLEKYHEGIREHVGKINGEAPILKAFFAHNPGTVLVELDKIQEASIAEADVMLEPHELIAIYEERLREELPPSFVAAAQGSQPKKSTPQSPPAASETKVAPTISAQGLASPARPRERPRTRSEEDAHAVAWLAEYQRTGVEPDW